MFSKALDKLLVPPKKPVDAKSSKEWEEVEHTLSVKLPDDWRDFCQTYGTGTILPAALTIFNPFSESSRQWMLDQVQEFAAQREEDPEAFLYELYPAKEGLLPFAATDQRVVFFYRMSGKPTKWPIVIWRMEDEDWNKHAMTMTELLIALLKGNAVATFPKNWATQEEKPSFRSASATADGDASPEVPKLIAAIMDADAKLVRTLLDEGADPNAVGEDGSSALALAAYKDPQFVQLLLEHGADINSTSGPMIATALAFAIYWDQPASAEILIKAGADPNIADFIGETPLFRAAEKHDVDLARLLLSAGADPNVQGQDGKTAIRAAISTGDVEMIKTLLDAGAKVDVRDNRGETPLERAIDFAPDEIVELLQSRGRKQ